MTATLTTLVSFDGDNGSFPGRVTLIADANGDLFGTTSMGGANGKGTVFEIAKTPTGYASAPTTLASDGSDAGLIADADGDLFGANPITAFEIDKTAGGYAGTPTTLVSFNPSDDFDPEGALILDANGNLFDTAAAGGANDDGTVFEIAKTPTGYASTPTTLVSFNEADGSLPVGSLIADAEGDLFGTTDIGGAYGDGTVFEIAKTTTGYASTPTDLVTFDGGDGADPEGGLILDANGDLFGTTSGGGADGGGTVFEIAKTGGGYASTPTTLASFDGLDGSFPDGSLIADANGDLFGTTSHGGPSGGIGTVFEIEKTGAGYASAPTTLAGFFDSNGATPLAGLIADVNGDLFGTTQLGGADDFGTVFEITGSGFVPVTPPPPPPVGKNDILFQNVSGQAALWDVDGATLSASALLGADPGPNWKDVATANFNGDTHPDILLQNASGAVAVWETNGANVTASAVVANPGPNWKAVGTSDFTGDGKSDILLQNANGAVAIWEMDGTSMKSSAVVANPGANWKVVGTGDFNGDGKSDILLQNANGSVAIWEMNGTSLATSAVVATPGPSWKVVGTGNFNDDGKADILLQNANGQVAIWEMNGTTMSPDSAIVSSNPGPNWRAIGTNGGADILFQNTSGQAAIWDMNGTTITGSGVLSANPGPNWRGVGLT